MNVLEYKVKKISQRLGRKDERQKIRERKDRIFQ